MVRTRAKLERLRKVAVELTEQQPLAHRLVIAPLLESVFSIVEDLIGEVEKLKGGKVNGS